MKASELYILKYFCDRYSLTPDEIKKIINLDNRIVKLLDPKNEDYELLLNFVLKYEITESNCEAVIAVIKLMKKVSTFEKKKAILMACTESNILLTENYMDILRIIASAPHCFGAFAAAEVTSCHKYYGEAFFADLVKIAATSANTLVAGMIPEIIKSSAIPYEYDALKLKNTLNQANRVTTVTQRETFLKVFSEPSLYDNADYVSILGLIVKTTDDKVLCEIHDLFMQASKMGITKRYNYIVSKINPFEFVESIGDLVDVCSELNDYSELFNTIGTYGKRTDVTTDKLARTLKVFDKDQK